MSPFGSSTHLSNSFFVVVFSVLSYLSSHVPKMLYLFQMLVSCLLENCKLDTLELLVCKNEATDLSILKCCLMLLVAELNESRCLERKPQHIFWLPFEIKFWNPKTKESLFILICFFRKYTEKSQTNNAAKEITVSQFSVSPYFKHYTNRSTDEAVFSCEFYVVGSIYS